MITLYDKIIDFHVHVFGEKVAKKALRATADHYLVPPEAEEGDLGALYDSISGFPIEKMVVHSTATKVSQVVAINDFIAGLTDSRFVKFGTMHPDFEDIEGEMRRMRAIGICGLKLHSDFQAFNLDDKKAYPMYEAAGECGFPVLFHVGDERLDFSHPRRLKAVAKDFPKLRIIAAHLGGRDCWEDSVENLGGCPNVWVDTSSAIGKLGAREAGRIIHEYGADRVLFATDFPMASHRMEIGRFMYVPMSDADRQKIFYDNAARLLNL